MQYITDQFLVSSKSKAVSIALGFYFVSNTFLCSKNSMYGMVYFKTFKLLSQAGGLDLWLRYRYLQRYD